MISCNLTWKEVQTPILTEKTLFGFPLDALYALHLIQLWLGGIHQLNSMCGRKLTFDLKIFNNCKFVKWRIHVPFERSICHIKNCLSWILSVSKSILSFLNMILFLVCQVFQIIILMRVMIRFWILEIQLLPTILNKIL